ncbi:hypothetical protein ACHQM5_028421 [Ranunculus cassubicifolius]
MNTSESRFGHNLSPISEDEEADSNGQNSNRIDVENGEDDQDMSSQLHVPNIICSNNFEDMIYVGMVFKSDKEAYEEYLLYALKIGFRVRKNKQYLRDDGTVRSRYFVCFREGERRKDRRYQYVRKESKERKTREETRTGCKARMAVKNLHNQWVVSEIIHEHNHPLTTPANAADIVADDKDRIIRELSEELHQEKRLRTACQKRIDQILKDVEEHSQNLSSKIEVAVSNVNKLDSEGIHSSDDNDS